jgi:hypothetical protein
MLINEQSALTDVEEDLETLQDASGLEKESQIGQKILNKQQSTTRGQRFRYLKGISLIFLVCLAIALVGILYVQRYSSLSV